MEIEDELYEVMAYEKPYDNFQHLRVISSEVKSELEELLEGCKNELEALGDNPDGHEYMMIIYHYSYRLDKLYNLYHDS